MHTVHESAFKVFLAKTRASPGLSSKDFTSNAGDVGDAGSIPGTGRSPGGGHATHSSIPARKSRGERNLASYSPKGCRESDTTDTTEPS